MSPSLVRFCAGGTPSAVVHRCVRRWVGVSLSVPRTRAQENNPCVVRPDSSTSRWLSSSGPGPSHQDIAELNEDISGFVGDLGDPDFDASPPRAAAVSPTPRSRRGASGSGEDNQAEKQVTPGAFVPGRLTLADHPSAVVPTKHAGPPVDTFEASTQERGTHSSTTLVTEGSRGEKRRHEQAPGTMKKSVLVLNGAACFITGKLASTGEQREIVMESMERAAAECDLTLNVCTSNREDKLLDELCEGEYDAIVYNPSGFWSRASGTINALVTPINGTTAERGRHIFVNTERGADDSRQQQMQDPLHQQEEEGCRRKGRDDLPWRQIMDEDGHPQWSEGAALEYGLARARCPVVVITPRDDATYGPRGPTSSSNANFINGIYDHQTCQVGSRGTISGFSGAASYRLALNTVASMLHEAQPTR